MLPNLRVGSGFDVHAFCSGRKCIIGGVEIPHDKGLAGHSDADVLIHSIIDSLLGASGLGDIGRLFPDTDDSFKNISSMILLEKTAENLFSEKWRIINIDNVIVCQEPRISLYSDKMKKNISEILKISTDLVSIKGKTTERLGFTGRDEGIAVFSTALLFRED
ncbi:MAG: 2-C-methyl-D-erythritol 2,4-cyclodiphosphate synthase [Spirochaetes bacterium]|nr:2-C-methyl-D-erythritol 2,4-cyclodiphosphate synthase [Spirochaetota bacterium]